MSKKLIYITNNDMKRLRELIMVAREFGNGDKKYLRELEDELDKGEVVNSRDIPHDVITMNSKVRLRDINTQKEMICWLVFPDDSNADQGKISILAPIGTALLGYKVGDIIEWRVPAGLTKLKVEEILYQPEAAGDYNL
ncbi:nucleoside diphosphate kinase regulator [bacterium]|nr:nucleoside diphosphate kinase regulator [bacterium]MBU4361326.1 nucleoside diphosphate kinase regulator [bacterium]MBU4601601.1 nucleoside diphosphate kinase regulator [bacterium]